jgi:glutamine amidotransferase
MIAVIDYGAGNIRSVVNAIGKLGHDVNVTSNPAEILGAAKVILPGVGAAADTMEGLRKLGLVEPVKRIIAEDRPFLGICIGQQVLFTATEEGGWSECLGIFAGTVRKLPVGLKIPHMGWNQVRQRVAHPIFEGVPDNANFYFVHSFYADPDDKSIVIGTTDYGVTINSVIAKGNLVATQFHPEKSGDAGLKVLDNFINNAAKAQEGGR